MSTYRIRVTQLLSGFYEGELEITAKNKKEALGIAKSMSNKEIDDSVDWSQGDKYKGNVDTIHIYKDIIYKK